MKCVWEHNGNDTLLYNVDCIGAYTRGENLEAAMAKMKEEVASYSLWKNQSSIQETEIEIEIVQEKNSDLQISDADSDVIFESENEPLTREEYDELKALALKSASDFHSLFISVPNANESSNAQRHTFYGNVPRTAKEMYDHTKSVNSYYFGEIGVEADNEGTIYECRKRGFERLEETEGFLNNTVFEGSYGEMWSLRKMIRRFVWHDRIHAKAMYRMALKTFGISGAENVFKFKI